jgi:hypothetical protein
VPDFCPGPVTGWCLHCREKNVAGNAEGKTVTVQCLHLEANVDYAIFIEQSWLANRTATKKTADNFMITLADTAFPKCQHRLDAAPMRSRENGLPVAYSVEIGNANSFWVIQRND